VRPFTRYATQSGSARLGWAFSEAWRLDVRAERFGADRVENPGDLYYAWGDGRSLKDVARSSAEAALSGTAGRHAVSARVFGALEEQEYYNAPEAAEGAPLFVNYTTPTRWRGVQLQDVIGFGAHALTLGADFTNARATSERFAAPGERAMPYSPDSETSSRALFAEARFALLDQRLSATLGGRFDRIGFRVLDTELLDDYTPNDERYTVFNPSAGLNYRFDSGLRAHASAGRAFVSPDAFQVAGRSVQRQGAAKVALTRGNAALDPESSVTWDAGLGVVRSALDADVTFFDTRVRDRITSRRTLPTEVELTAGGDTIESITTYVNADAARMRGVEWRLGYDFGLAAGRAFSLRAFSNATHLLRAEETTADITSDIRNVAALSLNYGVEYDDLRRFNTRLSGRYVGARSDMDYTDWTNPAEVRYPRFMTLDWTGELRLTERYRLGLALTNLTDESYYEIRGYPLPGRAVQARFAIDF
jgi:outer membrane receptor protein involved in Fe transport